MLPLINQAWKKLFARTDKNLESIIDRVYFHLYRRILKHPAILKTKIMLDNEQLNNQHDPTLQNHRSISSIIRTDNLKIVSDITPPTNTQSVLSFNLNKSEGADENLLLTTSRWSAGREGIGTSTVVRGKWKGEGGQKRDGHHEAQKTRNSERSEGSKTGKGPQSLGGSLKLCAKAGRGRAAGPL